MKIPRALVMKQDALVNRALASLLLTSSSQLTVIVSEALDMRELVAEISKIKPDAVLLSESIPSAAKDSFAQLLMAYPKLRVIVVSEDSNWIHIFRKEDVLLNRLTDLLEVIH
jgi:DNA-binding NarL/FixJ family response regulator